MKLLKAKINFEVQGSSLPSLSLQKVYVLVCAPNGLEKANFDPPKVSQVKQQRVNSTWKILALWCRILTTENSVMWTTARFLLALLFQILHRSTRCEHIFSLSHSCTANLSYFTVSKRKKKKEGRRLGVGGHEQKFLEGEGQSSVLTLTPGSFTLSADDCVGGFRIQAAWGWASVTICADSFLQQQQSA